jgi:PX domain
VKTPSFKSSTLSPLTPSRRSTIHQFTKDVFISKLQVAHYEEQDSHVSYIIKVEGRTKYLIDIQQAM